MGNISVVRYITVNVLKTIASFQEGFSTRCSRLWSIQYLRKYHEHVIHLETSYICSYETYSYIDLRHKALILLLKNYLCVIGCKILDLYFGNQYELSIAIFSVHIHSWLGDSCFQIYVLIRLWHCRNCRLSPFATEESRCPEIRQR